MVEYSYNNWNKLIISNLHSTGCCWRQLQQRRQRLFFFWGLAPQKVNYSFLPFSRHPSCQMFCILNCQLSCILIYRSQQAGATHLAREWRMHLSGILKLKKLTLINICIMIKEKQFWDWFKLNEAKYFFLNQIDDDNQKERLLGKFLERLHIYCDHLFLKWVGIPMKSRT
jgi:hypothetical protein